MQPLYSVDHETRQNSHRVEDNSPIPEEETPLLYRFPEINVARGGCRRVIIFLMLAFLFTAVVIAIYLMIIQSKAENILPPIETPLQLVSRKQWLTVAGSQHVVPLEETTFSKAKQVIIVQTDTEPCSDTYSCALLLQSLQVNTTSGAKLLPYNFLVSTNGQTFEALGWHRSSPMFPQYADSLLLAFIGNFTDVPPSKLQIDEAKNFFAESVSQQHLVPSYEVFGKNTAYAPALLFSSLNSLPRWNGELTDA